MRECGIFALLSSGKRLILASTNIQGYWYNEISRLRRRRCAIPEIQALFDKYGKEAVKLEILEHVPLEAGEQALRARFWHWVAHFNTTDPRNGWNERPKARLPEPKKRAYVRRGPRPRRVKRQKGRALDFSKIAPVGRAAAPGFKRARAPRYEPPPLSLEGKSERQIEAERNFGNWT